MYTSEHYGSKRFAKIHFVAQVLHNIIANTSYTFAIFLQNKKKHGVTCCQFLGNHFLIGTENILS